MEKDPQIGTQPLLEAKSGLGQSTVSRVLLCQGWATLKSIDALAQAIGCEPWELLIDEEASKEAIVRRFMK